MKSVIIRVDSKVRFAHSESIEVVLEWLDTLKGLSKVLCLNSVCQDDNLEVLLHHEESWVLHPDHVHLILAHYLYMLLLLSESVEGKDLCPW